MGRAIVRDPQVFLFDEPLSNLDAKLRVQMRTEIKELHQRLKTTSVYVTHDQIEAMTMADTDRRDERRQRRADRLAARALRQSGQPVRRRLHRLAGDEFPARQARANGSGAAVTLSNGSGLPAPACAGSERARRDARRAPRAFRDQRGRRAGGGRRGRAHRRRHAGLLPARRHRGHRRRRASGTSSSPATRSQLKPIPDKTLSVRPGERRARSA